MVCGARSGWSCTEVLVVQKQGFSRSPLQPAGLGGGEEGVQATAQIGVSQEKTICMSFPQVGEEKLHGTFPLLSCL